MRTGASTSSATDGARDRQNRISCFTLRGAQNRIMHYCEYRTGPIYIRSSDHEHKKMGCRGVRGRVMWLTPSFGDRVEHGEWPLEVV